MTPTLESIRDFRGTYPRQLWWLFLTEMWERFCFYGLRGMLTVFMVTQLDLGEKDANLQYGAIQAFVYAFTFIGGVMADKILGFQRSLFWGALLMIAGGVGIGPIRSLLERIGPETEPVILYRARSEKELVHVEELNELAGRVNGRVQTIVGPTSSLTVKDPFSTAVLLNSVPDLKEREVVVAGPESLLFAAYKGLRAAGIDPLDIHFERPWW